jgi:formylmethanofuran dehydrogenase subunit C
VFNTRSTTVNNAQTIFVGDGTNPATYHLLGGIHSFANNLRIRNNGTLSGCGTINGSVIVDPGGTVLADCGGTLTFTGIVTNNGSWKAINGSVLESFGPVVNNGVLNVIDGHTNFLAGFVNNGVVLTADNLPQILSVTRIGTDVKINFTTVNTLTHVFEFTSNLVSQGWTPLLSFTGSGGITSITDPGAAMLPQRFYRVRLVVPP